MRMKIVSQAVDFKHLGPHAAFSNILYETCYMPRGTTDANDVIMHQYIHQRTDYIY